MIDHVGFAVSNYTKAKAFYSQALAPLSISLIMEIPPEHAGGKHHAGFGTDQRAFFWIGDNKAASATTHLAFVANSRADVDHFHAAAIAAGGMDNGEPGLRPLYHPNYYAAFVLDPDGNNIEAVCHKPE